MIYAHNCAVMGNYAASSGNVLEELTQTPNERSSQIM
jgi:hypothetical protein